MTPGTKVTFKPEAWARYQRETGGTDPAPEGVEVIHVAGDRTTLRGYVWLGLPWCWWRVEDLTV